MWGASVGWDADAKKELTVALIGNIGGLPCVSPSPSLSRKAVF